MSILQSLLLLTFFFQFILKQVLSSHIEEQRIKDFRSNPLGISEKEGIFPVFLGNDTQNMRIMAYVYFNDDKYIDLACVESLTDSNNIVFFEYNYDDGVFEKNKNKTLSDQLKYPNKNILNLQVLDLNSDNSFDLVISMYDTKTKEYLTEIVVYNRDSYNFVKLKIDNLSTKKDLAGTLIADVNGDGLIDILYYDSSIQARRFVTYNNSRLIYTDFETMISKDSECYQYSLEKSKTPLSIPHSSTILDIDGDCINDLIIFSTDQTTKTRKMEIWKGWANQTLAYCLFENNTKILDERVGPISFADIDRDGFVDIVFPVIKSTKEYPVISVVFNQIKNEIDWAADYCKERLPARKTQVSVFPPIKTEGSDDLYTQIFITLKDHDQAVIYSDPENNIQPLVRIGDINNDSFPDLIVTFLQVDNGHRGVVVFLSQQYKPDKDAEETNGPIPERRTFKYDPQNNLTSYILDVSEKVVYSSFFDLDENGQLDILAVILDDLGNYVFKGFYNNFNYDAFYLKGVTLYDKQHFTTTEIGTSYRYITTNLDGSRRMDTSFQLVQNNQLSLNLPFTFIGIGRSNNYIENFCVITTLFLPGKKTYEVFTPIIPNSQLIISTNYNSEKNDFAWYLDLIVNPTSQLYILIITIICILVVNLAFIIYLHYKEVQEDKDSDVKVFALWYK